MAIKRLTIELDDAPDRGGQTSPPESLLARPEQSLKERELTSPPTGSEPEETDASRPGIASTRPTGRTFPDLIAEFVNEPRAIATILMFASFLAFVVKTKELSDLANPLIVGILLNIVWFGVPWVARFRRK